MQNSTLTWRKGWFLSATFLLLISLLAVSCKKKEHKLGEGVVDESELMNSGSIDTFSLYTSMYEVDSVISSSSFYGILGSYQDPVFGYMNSEIYTQIELNQLSPTFGDLADITIDSVVLSLVYGGKYGNDGDQTIEVFELGGSGLDSDSTYYTFSSIPEKNGSNLVVPGQDVYYMDVNSVTYIDSLLVEPQLRIMLDTNLGWQLFNEWDSNPTSFSSNENFTDFFKGFKIKVNNGTQQSGEGGMFYFDIEDSDSKLTVYYKSAGERRKFDYVLHSGSKFNHIDITQSMAVQMVLDNPSLGQEQFYTQSHKSRAIVSIPGLSNIPPNSVIHSAILELPVQYQSGQPFEPGLDVSVRMFRSTTDSSLVTNGTIGLYDVASKKFTMDVKDYVQRIVSGELENSGFVISPRLFFHTADRIIFNGPETTNKAKPKFKIIYTEY